jgi:hypothetical protein
MINKNKKHNPKGLSFFIESGQAELNRYYTHPKGTDCRYPMARNWGLFFLANFFDTLCAGLDSLTIRQSCPL